MKSHKAMSDNFVFKDGAERWIEANREAQRLAESLDYQNHILEIIVKGFPDHEILTQIVTFVENQIGIGRCSILLLEGQTLYHGAADKLPDSYIKSLYSIEIGPQAGSCGTAAYHNKRVIVSDIENDPLWSNYKEVALEHGLKSCWSTPIADRKGNVLGTFAVYYDQIRTPKSEEITVVDKAAYLASLFLERQKSDQQIIRMAYYDDLTGLPNRKQFCDLLSSAIQLSEQQRGVLSVLCLDLDEFKIVNDALGHAIGDKLLKQVAQKLSSCAGSSGLVSRQGGDEFSIYLLSTTVESTEQLASSIIRLLAEPFIIEEEELYISTSIGISYFPSDGDNVDTLIKHADAALYQAKRQGKNMYQRFLKEYEYQSADHSLLFNGLRKALEQHEFELYYQPQIAAQSHEITGVEALLRWNHPQQGLLYPAKFIDFAEKVGLIHDIGRWVLRRACRQWQEWRRKYNKTLKLAVNVSVRQLYEPSFVEYIDQALADSDMDPECLEIEITESFMIDIDRSHPIIQHLKDRGILVSIDDFGTGFSSLSYLKAFPIDRIKVDRSFITDITTEVKDQSLVKTIVALGKNMNAKVIAEGVETLDQLQLLCQYEVDEAQGYYFSPPVPSSDLEQLLFKSSKVRHD